MNSPLFEIVTTTAGAISIRDNSVNEIMHNPVGPWKEANALYIDQSQFEMRLLSQGLPELVLFDVGLGAAANALAALQCKRRLSEKSKTKLRIISFEKNLELLEFALSHAEKFDHFQGFERAIEDILSKHEWSDGQISWQLRLGDFTKTIIDETERPDLIFYDPYSPKVNREVWTTACFEKLYAKSKKEAGTSLYTYSQATPIRAALLAAGFYVGLGNSTGLKEDTTQASTRLEDLASPLGERWISRWKSSHTPYPYDCGPEDEALFREKILNHPQFARFS